jgi:hypothetical protein
MQLTRAFSQQCDLFLAAAAARFAFASDFTPLAQKINRGALQSEF